MIPIIAIALLAAKPDPAHPAWMIGTWGWQNDGEQGVDCGSDHDFTYNRDGTYHFVDTRGTWHIDGDSLVEVQTDAGETGDPSETGKPSITRFKRVRPGVLSIAGEYPGKMIKCPVG